jgi:hypothetical protein
MSWTGEPLGSPPTCSGISFVNMLVQKVTLIARVFLDPRNDALDTAFHLAIAQQSGFGESIRDSRSGYASERGVASQKSRRRFDHCRSVRRNLRCRSAFLPESPIESAPSSRPAIAPSRVALEEFWKPGDFWASNTGQGRTLIWDFLKNFALGAGFSADHVRKQCARAGSGHS